MSPRGTLSCDIVIATRNRPEALALSLPLLLSQSHQPERLIVIDASDEHAPVAAAVAEATRDWPGEVIVEHSERGSSYQRNRGMVHVKADVVVFPDDDSMFYPGALEAMMAAYERDTGNEISAVCAAEAMSPPEGLSLGGAYEMTRSHQSEAETRSKRNRLEKHFPQLKPSLFLGALLRDRHPRPDWLKAQNCVAVEYMTGFRMSFRTERIAETGFDETLRNYALDEDVEASFSVAQKGLIIGALDAKIYHHRFPSGRGDGYTRGAIEVLNRIYVVRKHSLIAKFDPADRRRLLRGLTAFVRLKVLISLLHARDEFGRAGARGALAAALRARPLWRADNQATLSQAYGAVVARLGI